MAYHKLEKNELQCYLCQKEFEHKGGLELHLKVKTNKQCGLSVALLFFHMPHIVRIM